MASDLGNLNTSHVNVNHAGTIEDDIAVSLFKYISC